MAQRAGRRRGQEALGNFSSDVSALIAAAARLPGNATSTTELADATRRGLTRRGNSKQNHHHKGGEQFLYEVYEMFKLSSFPRGTLRKICK